MKHLHLGIRWSDILNCNTQLDAIEKFQGTFRLHSRVLLELRLTLFLDEQSPNSSEKTINPLDTFCVPGFDHFQRAEKHFIEAKGVGAEFPDHVIGINDVASCFGHFLTIFSQNEPL